MPQNPHEPWQPPAKYYSSLVERARKHDPSVIVGVASAAEIARMEKLVERLEGEALERAREKAASDPCNLASVELRHLWHRAHEARQAIVKMQTTQLGKQLFTPGTVYWHPELLALEPPAEFFETPRDVGIEPTFRTLEEADALAFELRVKADALEALSSKIGQFLHDWGRLSFEQQNRRLIMKLFDRVDEIADGLSGQQEESHERAAV